MLSTVKLYSWEELNLVEDLINNVVIRRPVHRLLNKPLIAAFLLGLALRLHQELDLEVLGGLQEGYLAQRVRWFHLRDSLSSVSVF